MIDLCLLKSDMVLNHWWTTYWFQLMYQLSKGGEKFEKHVTKCYFVIGKLWFSFHVNEKPTLPTHSWVYGFGRRPCWTTSWLIWHTGRCFAFAHIWYYSTIVDLTYWFSLMYQHKFEKHVIKYFFCDRKIIFLHVKENLGYYIHSFLTLWFWYGVLHCCSIEPTMYNVKVLTFFF
jgi:hypothetical protein